MAHNKVKVAGQSPNKDGEITVNVEHLDDVTISSLQANQILQYSGGNWINADTSALSGGTVLFVGDGTSTNYPTGGSEINVSGRDLHFYNIVYNGISATAYNGSSVVTGSGWIDSIQLPAGTYLCNAVAAITFSSSNGFASYRWYNQTAPGFVCTRGNVKQSTDSIGSSCSAYVTSTSSMTLSVRLDANPTDVQLLTAQASRQAEYGYIEIRKLA